MAKRLSLEFKQQAINYALANSHEPLASIGMKLSVGYATLDKWIGTANSESSSKRPLLSEQHKIIALKKEVK